MPSSFMYVIAVESDSLNFQILLNDVPVKKVLEERPVMSQTNVNQWIVEGANVVEVRLGLSSGGGPGRADDSGSFQLRLFGGEHGREPDPKDALIEFIWDAAAQPLGDQMVTVFTKEFQAEVSFGRWRWQDAPSIPLTDSDKRELVQVIRKIHRAVSEKDLDALTELMKLNSQEMARAMDIDEETIVMGGRQVFSSLFESDGWRVEPLEESTLLFQPVAGGRLVAVTPAGGQPLVRGEGGGGGEFAMSFIFGRVAGAWHVFRSGA